jgi:hypothetical protein
LNFELRGFLIMTDAIDNMGGSTPFDMGDMQTGAQDGMQPDAQFNTVRMFPPNDAGDAHAMPTPAPAATQGAGAAAQGSGTTGSNTGPNIKDIAGAISQILDIFKGALSMATPILGLITSLAGSAGSAGSGAA